MGRNEYDEMLENLGQDSQELNEYDAGLQQQKINQKAQVQSSLHLAQGKKSERQAEVLKLSQDTGLPSGVVERQYDLVKSRHEVASQDYDSMVRDNPGVSKYLSNHDNAALSQREVEQLKATENYLQKLREMGGPTEWGEFGEDISGAFQVGYNNLIASTIGLAPAYGAANIEDVAETMAEYNKRSQDISAKKPDYAKQWQEVVLKEGRDVGRAFEKWMGAIPLYLEGKKVEALEQYARGNVETIGEMLDLIWAATSSKDKIKGLAYTTAESAAYSAPALATGFAAGKVGAAGGAIAGPLGATVGGVGGFAAGTFAGSVSTEIGAWMNQEIAARGYDITNPQDLVTAYKDPSLMAEIRAEAERKGIATAAVDAMFSMVAGRIKIKGLKGAPAPVRKVVEKAADVGVQAAGESAGEAAGQVAAKGYEGLDAGEVLLEGLASLGHSAAEVTIAPVATGVKEATAKKPKAEEAAPGREKYSEDPTVAIEEVAQASQEAIKTAQQIKALQAIGQQMQEMKDTTAVPGKFAELIETASEGSETDSVYFQADDFDSYWNRQGLSPAQAAEQIIEGGAKKYYEAKENGHPIKLPLGQFLEKTGAGEHFGGLSSIAMVKPDGMSLQVAQEVLNELPGVVNQIAKEAKEKVPTREQQIEKEASEFASRIEEQLVESGRYTKQDAKQLALVYSERIKRRAEIRGITPQELVAERGIEIEGVETVDEVDGRVFEQAPVESQEFKEWFGDSKVVDESGKPLVVYHGTMRDFESFQEKPGEQGVRFGLFGFHVGSKDAANVRLEALFGKDYFKHPDENVSDKREQVLPLYLKAENSLRLDENRTGAWGVNDILTTISYMEPTGNITQNDIDAIGDDALEHNGVLFSDLISEEDQRDFLRDWLESKGYDSIVYKNEFEGGGDSYIAFRPTQIKSAIGNKGTYSKDDPRILYQAPIPPLTKSEEIKQELSEIGGEEIGLEFYEGGYDREEYHYPSAEQEFYVWQDEDDPSQLFIRSRETDKIEAGPFSNRAEVAEYLEDIGTELDVIPRNIYEQDEPNVTGERAERAQAEGFDLRYSWFHGTSGDIEAFSMDTLGSSTGAGSARLAHFFASSPETASDYAEASDSALYLRSVRTEAEAERANADFKKRMREKYGSKWVSNLSADEKAERAQIKKQFAQALEDFKISQQPAYTVDRLKSDIEMAERNLEYYKKSIAENHPAEKRAKFKKTLEFYKEIEQGEWVLDDGGRFYNIFNKKTGERYVNPAFKGKPEGDETRYKFYDRPDNNAARIKKIERGIRRYTLAQEKKALRETEKSLAEMKDSLAKALSGKDRQTVYKTVLKMQNPLIVDFGGAPYREVTYRAIIEKAQEKGFDSVIFKNTYDPAFVGGGAKEDELIDVAAIFEPSQVRSVSAKFEDFKSPLILAQEAKGRIRIGEASINIDLFKTADISTMIHETSHAWLEEMRLDYEYISQIEGPLTTAQQQFLEDTKAVLKHFNVESFEDITVEMHEEWARLGEAYFMEGKAPSERLRKAFARFKTWLITLYKNLKNLNVEMSQDIREVMSRLIASDEQIDELIGEQNLAPMIPEDILTKAEAERYAATAQEARGAASEILAQKLMADWDREKKAWWKEKKAEIKEEVENEVENMRVYKALDQLRYGKTLDGSSMKLSREALVEMFDAEFIKSLPKPFIYTRDGGLNPEMAAGMLGYESASEMLDDIAQAPNKKQLIDTMTDARMGERYPNMFADSDDMKEQATRYIHNEKYEEMLQFELEYLAKADFPTLKQVTKKLIRRVPARGQIRKEATRILGATIVDDIKPHLYLRAEAKASKDAAEAWGKGDIQGAFEAKRRQIINFELYKQAQKALEKIDKAKKRFKKLNQKDEKLAKSRDINFILAARAILSTYGLGKSDKTAEQHLEPIKKYDPMGYEVISQLVSEAQLAPGKDPSAVTYADFADLDLAIESLWNMSKTSQDILISGKKVRLEDTRLEVIGALTDNFRAKKNSQDKYNRAKSGWEKIKSKIMGAMAFGRKAEHLTLALDLGDVGGVVQENITAPIRQAQEQYNQVKIIYLKKLKEILSKADITYEPIQADEFPQPYEFKDKAELLGALLHIGNESNLKKLLVGRGWGFLREDGTLDKSAWDTFFKRMQAEGVITKADMDMIQETWDLFEEIKPMAQVAHKQIFGHHFNEITANEFETDFGNYRGGYAPAAIDPDVVQDHAARAADKEFLEANVGSFFPYSGGDGFGKNRVDGYNKPLALDLRLAGRHLDQVLRFSIIKPRVIEVAKLINHEDFRAAMMPIDENAVDLVLMPYLNRVDKQITQMRTPRQLRGAIQAVRYIKAGAAAQIMFGNAKNVVEQSVQVAVLKSLVPDANVLKSTYKYSRNSKKMTQDMNEASSFMAERSKNQMFILQRELDNILSEDSLGKKVRDWGKDHAYYFQAALQNHMDVIVWDAVYEHQIEQGDTHDKAVKAADKVVVLTQSDFSPAAKSSAETIPFMDLFAMFYGYFNMMANVAATKYTSIVYSDLSFKKKFSLGVHAYYYTIMLPSVFSAIVGRALAGKGFDEDDDDEYLDDIAEVFFMSQVKFIGAMVPVAGPAAVAGVSKYDDTIWNDRLSSSPALSAISNVVGAGAFLTKDEIKKKDVKDLLSIVGTFTQLPIGAAGRPIGYMMDVQQGKKKPTGPIDYGRGLITGK